MADARPFFSVIVPAYGRPTALAACLQALAAQTYPRERLEVLVVDDGSDPPEARALAECAEQGGARLLRQSFSGPAAARNLGAACAQGTHLAFTDDDCRPAPAWLAALAAALSGQPAAGAGGAVVNALPHNPYAAASQALVGYLYAYYNRDPQHAVFFTSNNLALPAEAFRAQGGFDSTLRLAAAEDRDLCDRWVQCHHGRLLYVPQAVVAHAPDLTARRFWAQHFRYGRGAHGYHLARRARGAPPVPVEPPAFYGNLLRHVAAHAPPGRAAQGALLAVISQLANALGFIYERRRHAARAAVPKPATS
ncbi:MAG: glycosyltransferase [Anaerolineales bacterium]|nr:glycosyltransferase [Anaerolineales bacterium]